MFVCVRNCLFVCVVVCLRVCLLVRSFVCAVVCLFVMIVGVCLFVPKQTLGSFLGWANEPKVMECWSKTEIRDHSRLSRLSRLYGATDSSPDPPFHAPGARMT